jgi:hypothetical protein
MSHELGYVNVINNDKVLVTLIWNELYEPEDKNCELKLVKLD